MSFVWDESFRLFRREGYFSLSYSDGPEAESRLLEVVQNATDRSTLSSELAASISDWPSEYHLSRSRHCLIRPLAIAPGDSVLELGCGCGAITRYLGEIGADVVAVEGSLLRARIAAERCRDLANVQIFVDDLLAFETGRKFDWVLLIGVLEYAPAFSTEQNQALHYLTSTRRFLAPGGRMVLAIENKLGLKYFNGCGEDHTGIPFSGVQDLYRPKTVRTFGRKELTKLLSAAGLSHAYFHYPFPDYKLPAVILSDDAVTDPDFDPVDLLVRCQGRDYSGWPYRGFDEALVFPSLHNNGLLADLSNSFLVVATAEAETTRHSQDVAVAFSVHRAPEFATQTKFVRAGSEIRVLKEPLTSLAPAPVVLPNNLTLTNHLTSSAYRPGRQVLWELLKARARTGDLEGVVEALHPWMKFLLQHAHVPASQVADTSWKPLDLAGYVVPGNFVDCTPFNVLDTDGELAAIDLEWHGDSDIPLGWVVTRGVLWSLPYGVPAEDKLQSVVAVIESLGQSFDLSVVPSDIQKWLEQEASFQVKVLGISGTISPRTSGEMRSVVNEVLKLQQLAASQEGRVASLNRALTAREAQIANLNEILTWRDEMVARLTSAEDQARSEMSTLRKQAGQLQENLRETTAKLDAVLTSRSWRLTSSLRWVKKRIPALGLGRFRQQRQVSRDVPLVVASGLFDAGWYLQRNTDVAKAGADPMEHYLMHGGTEGRDPGPSFSSKNYLEQNPDVQVAGVNPLVHYLRFGRTEGRRASRVEESSQSDSDVFSYMSTPIDPVVLPRRVAIGVSSQGNFFMTEIARMIEDAFRQLGAETRLFDDRDVGKLAADEMVIVVAPHEFFLLGEGPQLFEMFRRLPKLVMFNTEQPQTAWFAEASKYLNSATAVLDINYESAQELARSGHKSFFLPLGYSDYIVRTFDGSVLPEHELLRYMSPSTANLLPLSYSDRPIDVLFVGTSSPRRSEFFAANAGFFADKNTIIYMPTGDKPFISNDSRTVDFAALVALVRRAKVLLNIHRDPHPYLEWQRIVTLGILQKTLVISDHCERGPCIEANRDYLDGSLQALPTLCDLALNSIGVSEAIAHRAYERLKSDYPMEQVVGRCFTALAGAIGAS